MPQRKKTAIKKNSNGVRTKDSGLLSGQAMNGLSEAVMGFQPGGPGTQLNQTTTLFKNNRWYLMSNMRQLLSEIYVEHGIIQTIVDVPVDDAFRGGIEIKTKQLGPEELELLEVTMEREGDVTTVAQTNKWNRLYGGAGTVIITDQDPMTPLQPELIGPDTPLEFRAADMWELFWTKQNTKDYAAAIDSQGPDVEFYSYYGVQVHKSRVMIMKGVEAPSFIRPRLRGWGVSKLETLVNSINQYLKTNNLVFEVLDEFKVDVYKIKNLVNSLMSPNGQQKIFERIQTANLQKNFQHAITMDSEDDFITKELSFTGIAETMEGIRMQIASDMRMPLTKIFGTSAQGFSSGEDDIENYNAMVESEVRQKTKFHVVKLVELRCQQLFGFIPDDISISFKPLRILSAEQEENVKTAVFNRVMAAMSGGFIDQKEFRECVNKDDLLPIQLDPNVELLQQEAGNEGDGESGNLPEGKGFNKKPKSQLKEAPKAKNSIDGNDRFPWHAKPLPFVKNSLAYDVAEFKADGGEGQFIPQRRELYEADNRHGDKGLWQRAKEASGRAFGRYVWQFAAWFYKKKGGKYV